MNENTLNAKVLFEEGELMKSLELLNSSINQNPDDVMALLLRARVSYRMQKWGDAINDFASVLDIDANNQEAKSGMEMAQNILGYFTPDMFNP